MKSSLTRRQFLKSSACAAFGLNFTPKSFLFQNTFEAAVFSFGIVTDLHYADRKMRNNRYYRDSVEKLIQCVEGFNLNNLPFIVELGDLVDKAPDIATELNYLVAMRGVFEKFTGSKHYVLGNHDLSKLSKGEFLKNCGASVKESFYSFDEGGYHFVILDANFRGDGKDYEKGNFKWEDTSIPVQQLDWLKHDLKRAGKKKTFVFVHQNLHDASSPHGVNNADQVRSVLENDGGVLAVFQGHEHKGGYRKLNGIHYCTLKALVDGPAIQNNAYGIVLVDQNDKIRLRGFGKQEDIIFA
jgi:3',5'-cyclic AMP phosphodiesterase CpdA